MIQMEYKCLDETSRVFIPGKFREALGLDLKKPLKIYIEKGKIVIEKAVVKCRMCGCYENMIEGFEICRPCAQKAALLVNILENDSE